jgi:glucoamylase
MNEKAILDAPGGPGIPGRWTSSAKSGVGTSLGPASRVWFTLSHGILNEIYYPRVDIACTRDLGFLVTDGAGFFSEEKRDATHEVTTLAAGVPAYRLTNVCAQKRYRIEKEVVADPQRPVLLQRTRFIPLQGARADYRLYALLALHLGNRGGGNSAWLDDYKGVPVFFAERNGIALALACSAGWRQRSVGFVGASDGWQELRRDGSHPGHYSRALNGNVAATGEVALSGGDEFVLALGFGGTPYEAAHQAAASLLDGFGAARDAYVGEWREWQREHDPVATTRGEAAVVESRARTSAMVIRAHEDKTFPGATIASLSIPWGFNKGDDDLGGYHLVWPRDMAETAGALLALGAAEDVRRALCFLRSTQEADGHWPQNMWLDGQPYWNGLQMDETSFPILLADQARREGALDAEDLGSFWPMVRRAVGFLVVNGPVTQQDRWEEDPGYSPFTLAAEVAALLAAADMAELSGARAQAAYLRETADAWNDRVEDWTYVTGTELARRVGVEGYYVRIAPPEEADAASPKDGFVPIKNRPPGQGLTPAALLVSPDALALVRFGLRAPDDPRIVNTVRVIDALLRVETPSGPAWRRYNEDGYGEHDDGSPFDGTGTGRAWPLLTGERAHYELAAGRRDEAERLRRALESFASEGGLIPEQVWDAPDVPDRELWFGRPAGSAMPLVWAHAEHLKLLRSLRDGSVFDLPPQTVQRYQVNKVRSPHAVWRFNHKCRRLPAGRSLRVELQSPALVRWSADAWRSYGETNTQDSGLGIHFADLPTAPLAEGSQVNFTFLWAEGGRWEGRNYDVTVAGQSALW